MTMEFLRFLRPKLPGLALYAAALFVVSGLLRLVGTPRDMVYLVVVTLSVVEVGRLTMEYLPSAGFWRRVRLIGRAHPGDSPNALDLACGLPSLRSGRAALVDDAVDALLAQASADVAAVRADSAEYRAFIERWSHEVKTPVAAASLIVQANPGPVSSRIAPELQRIEDYVDQALFLARSYTVDRDYVVRETTLGELVRDVVRARATLIQESGVSVSFDGLDQRVYCDPKWCGFIVGQLVDNACKYVGAEEAPRLSFTGRRLAAGGSAERVELVVADNGVGIAPQDLPRVWDKGFVGSNGRDLARSNSTGIGLFLVRDLCRKMGVEASVFSDGESGTEFHLVFPMVQRG